MDGSAVFIIGDNELCCIRGQSSSSQGQHI